MVLAVLVIVLKIRQNHKLAWTVLNERLCLPWADWQGKRCVRAEGYDAGERLPKVAGNGGRRRRTKSRYLAIAVAPVVVNYCCCCSDGAAVIVIHRNSRSDSRADSDRARLVGSIAAGFDLPL